MSRRHLGPLMVAILLPATLLTPAIADQWPIFYNGRLLLPSIFGHQEANPTQTKGLRLGAPGGLDRSMGEAGLDRPRSSTEFGVFYGSFDDGSQGPALGLDRPERSDSDDDRVGLYWIQRFR